MLRNVVYLKRPLKRLCEWTLHCHWLKLTVTHNLALAHFCFLLASLSYSWLTRTVGNFRNVANNFSQTLWTLSASCYQRCVTSFFFCASAGSWWKITMRNSKIKSFLNIVLHCRLHSTGTSCKLTIGHISANHDSSSSSSPSSSASTSSSVLFCFTAVGIPPPAGK